MSRLISTPALAADCPTQCPYDAITMVPRIPEQVVEPSLMTRLKGMLSLSTPAPPPAREADEMVAINAIFVRTLL